jgi:hypothetical protein
MQSIINIWTHNGLANRLNIIISALRLSKMSNRILNISWLDTPVRSCLDYIGEYCKFEDMFEDIEGVIVSGLTNAVDYQKLYQFPYWEDKDYVIDVSGNDSIFITHSLYTVISHTDDVKSVFANLKQYIVKPNKVEFDYIGIELGNILRNDIKPIKELQNEIDKCFKTYFKNMVGVHIRKSDGGFVNYDWENIIKILLPRLNEWCGKNEDNGVFLATDDPEVFIEFASKLKKKLICYDPPEILCKIKSTSDDSKFNNDKYNVLCAVVELYLLGKCNKYLIGTADSTFSFCGMLMTDNNTQKYLINSPENVPLIN